MLTIKDSCTVHKETPDTTKPVIKLNGEETITIKLNDTYKDAGATATDDKDGDITNKIVITGKVDTSKAGTYIITYTVEDLAKNVAIAKRTVIVKANQVEPEPQPEPEPEPEPTPTPTPEPNPEPQPDQNETVNNTGVN